MSTTLDRPKPTLESLRPALALAAFGRAHPVIRRIELFGSVARGESAPASDVDVVVEFGRGAFRVAWPASRSSTIWKAN